MVPDPVDAAGPVPGLSWHSLIILVNAHSIKLPAASEQGREDGVLYGMWIAPPVIVMAASMIASDTVG